MDFIRQLGRTGRIGLASNQNYPQVILGLPPIRDLLIRSNSSFFLSVDNEVWKTTTNGSVEVVATNAIPDQLYLTKIPDQPMIKSARSIKA